MSKDKAWYPTDIAKGENRDEQETVDVNYDKIVHVSRTGKGALLQIENEEEWLPTSQIFYADDTIIEIPYWLAKDKGYTD